MRRKVMLTAFDGSCDTLNKWNFFHKLEDFLFVYKKCCHKDFTHLMLAERIASCFSCCTNMLCQKVKLSLSQEFTYSKENNTEASAAFQNNCMLTSAYLTFTKCLTGG